MGGLPTITRQQHSALERPRTGACATCALPRPKPGVLKPGTYELYFFEFKDFASARDVRRLGRPLVQERYKVPAASSTVYVFRHQGGRTTLAKTLHGYGPYTVTVRPGDGPVEIYVCLSHFALPAQRVAQYTSADGLVALRRRCVRFDPSPSTSVRPNSATTFDVVMPDWRRLSWELHAMEGKAMNALADYAQEPKRAQRRMLAELTLATAVQYEKKDRHVWDWLRGAPYTSHPTHGKPRQRLHGLDGKKYTECESELYQMQRRTEYLHQQVEEAAAAKYEWMAEDGYREMRWDSLTLPSAQNDTVRAEATLLTTASQSLSGQAYLKSYAISNGWYLRYLRNMRADEKQAVRTDPNMADAYWALLAAVGAVLLADSRPSDDRPQQNMDVAKYGAGAADAGTKGALKNPEQKATEKAKDVEKATEAAEKAEEDSKKIAQAEGAATTEANRQAKAAQTLADELTAAERSPTWVMEKVIIRSIRDVTGHAPGYAVYDAAHSTFVPRPGDYVGPAAVRTTRGATEPALATRATAARQAATNASAHSRARSEQATHLTEAAEHRAHAATLATHDANTEFINAKDFESKYTGHAWMTSGAAFALGILNLGLAFKAWRHASNRDTQVKLGGAVFDLMYSTEFVFARAAAGAERTAATTGAAEAPMAGRLLMGARFLGVLGGAVSVYCSFNDGEKARVRGDSELMVASYASAGGAVMLTGAALGSMLAGSAVADTVMGAWFVGLVGATSWTVIGAVVLLAAAAAIWYFTNPPVKDWLIHCPWSFKPASKSDDEQLKGLLQLLCTPQVSAKQMTGGAAGRPLTCVRVTLRPPLFFAGQSSMHCELTIYDVSQGAESLMAVHFAVPGGSQRFEIGPIDQQTMARLEYGPVPCTVRGPGAGRLRVSLRRDGEALAFDCDLMLSHALSSSERGMFDSTLRWYTVGGTARLKLWTAQAGSAWDKLTLDEFELPDTEIAGTD